MLSSWFLPSSATSHGGRQHRNPADLRPEDELRGRSTGRGSFFSNGKNEAAAKRSRSADGFALHQKAYTTRTTSTNIANKRSTTGASHVRLATRTTDTSARLKERDPWLNAVLDEERRHSRRSCNTLTDALVAELLREFLPKEVVPSDPAGNFTGSEILAHTNGAQTEVVAAEVSTGRIGSTTSSTSGRKLTLTGNYSVRNTRHSHWPEFEVRVEVPDEEMIFWYGETRAPSSRLLNGTKGGNTVISVDKNYPVVDVNHQTKEMNLNHPHQFWAAARPASSQSTRSVNTVKNHRPASSQSTTSSSKNSSTGGAASGFGVLSSRAAYISKVSPVEEGAACGEQILDVYNMQQQEQGGYAPRNQLVSRSATDLQAPSSDQASDLLMLDRANATHEEQEQPLFLDQHSEVDQLHLQPLVFPPSEVVHHQNSSARRAAEQAVMPMYQPGTTQSFPASPVVSTNQVHLLNKKQQEIQTRQNKAPGATALLASCSEVGSTPGGQTNFSKACSTTVTSRKARTKILKLHRSDADFLQLFEDLNYGEEFRQNAKRRRPVKDLNVMFLSEWTKVLEKHLVNAMECYLVENLVQPSGRGSISPEAAVGEPGLLHEERKLGDIISHSEDDDNPHLQLEGEIEQDRALRILWFFGLVETAENADTGQMLKNYVYDR
ncbi:unnamed protein product [Amoebophrya sp. A120]|nr:unnamed protein product [Amoebophrya sp. A120]|eukprot:GSA120T00014240001.1